MDTFGRKGEDMRTRETSLADRLKTAALATRAMLDTARAVDPSTKSGFAQQQEARRAAAMARDTRDAERRAVRRNALALEADKRAARKAAHHAEATARAAALEAGRKAARDVRYAARKARAKSVQHPGWSKPS
jgi:hypothetical protein